MRTTSTRRHPPRAEVQSQWGKQRSCHLLFAALLLFALPSTLSGQEISNPDLYLKSLGAATEAVGHYGLVEDPATLERVNRIGYRLAQRSGFRKFPFAFSVVDMPIPNAFALPAGQIFVTRGMLDLQLDDDMLAALLGHEIAHVTEEHFLRMRKRATLLTVLSQIATIGAAAIAANSNDTYQGPGGYLYRDSSAAALLQATQATGVVVSELLLRSYSRDNEDQSDEEGQRLAALAGFDPSGTRRLMERMQAMIPQTKAFGYWQTHPFFDQRVLAAEARERALVAQDPVADTEVAAFRQATQKTMLAFLDQPKIPDPSRETIKQSALISWPRGAAAEGLRLERLRNARELEEGRLTQSRDYGRVLELYKKEAAAVRELTPESPLLLTLTQDMGEMRQKLEELYPKALEVLDGGVHETGFLEAFLSNYPESPKSAKVALELGISYSRLRRETKAVEKLLDVWEAPDAGELAVQARRGLINLAPVLEQLSALETLATQERDSELSELATIRLDELASKYKEIGNGADYLKRFPKGKYALTVSHRLESLADTLYREMVLYQELGDSAKAIERANLILENAPMSAAAERLGRQLGTEDTRS